jgi:phosphosulfolactate synthase (CoM biosynthesis protein A)
MTDPSDKTELHQIIEELETLWADWAKASENAIWQEADYKAYCALMKQAMMDAGSSAVKAENDLHAKKDWPSKYRRLQFERLEVQKILKRMEIKRMEFEAERTNQANLRQIQ